MSALDEAYRKGVIMRKVVVLTCLLSLLVAAVALVGCGNSGGGSSTQTPQQVAKVFFAALAKKAATTPWNLLAAADQKAAKTKAAWETYLKTATVPPNPTIGKVTVKGNNATVQVTATFSGQKSTATVPLVKENGAWKVDMAKLESQ